MSKKSKISWETKILKKKNNDLKYLQDLNKQTYLDKVINLEAPNSRIKSWKIRFYIFKKIEKIKINVHCFI